MSKKTGTKKLNKLAVKKETITDLDIQNPDQVKAGAGSYICTVPPTTYVDCSNTCATKCPPYCIKAGR